MLCIMPLDKVVYLVSSFGMHARCAVLRVVQGGGYAHRCVAVLRPVQTAVMADDHFDDRDGSASALDS